MAGRPADALVEPVAKQPIPRAIDEVLSVGDWLNISHWVLKAIELVTGGLNPGQWAVEKFAGNWEAFAKAGDALVHVGEFYAVYAANIAEGKDEMLGGWQGNAATRADAYFTGLAEAVAAQQPPLTTMGQEIQTVASGIWGVVKALNSLLEQLLDACIIAGVALAAGAVASGTVVGGIVGFAAAGLEIWRAAALWKEILQTYDTAYNLIVGLGGAKAGLLGALQGLREHPLPAGAYDHPGA